jgi:phosphomannomutase
LFGYEEAIGFSVGELVRDKDGVSAAIRMAELCAHLKAQGKTLAERLDELAIAHGVCEGDQWSVRFDGFDADERMADIMTRLRASPPDALADSKVEKVQDLLSPEREGPRADVLVFFTADGTRLIVRPSGTEPKIKFYLELTAQAMNAAELGATRARLKARAMEVREDVSRVLGLPS